VGKDAQFLRCKEARRRLEQAQGVPKDVKSALAERIGNAEKELEAYRAKPVREVLIEEHNEVAFDFSGLPAYVFVKSVAFESWDDRAELERKHRAAPDGGKGRIFTVKLSYLHPEGGDAVEFKGDALWLSTNWKLGFPGTDRWGEIYLTCLEGRIRDGAIQVRKK
jgi:hypothetical protein